MMTMSDLSREVEAQRADELLASLSKVTLAGCVVLALAFSVLTGAGQRWRFSACRSPPATRPRC